MPPNIRTLMVLRFRLKQAMLAHMAQAEGDRGMTYIRRQDGAIDSYTLRHLDAWLGAQIRGDTCR